MAVVGLRAPERLGQPPAAGASLWIVHGSGTLDAVVGDDYTILDFEAALLLALRARGFERVVYSSLGRPIHYRDQQSRALTRQDRGDHRDCMDQGGSDPAVHRPRLMRRGRGPLGRQVVFGRPLDEVLAAPTATAKPDGTSNGVRSTSGSTSETASAATRRASSATSDASRVQMLRAVMSDHDGPRTAVVLSGTETMLNRLSESARRDLAVAFDDWLAGRERRGNLCVLLFTADSMSTVAEQVGRDGYLPTLANRLEQIRDGRRAASEVLHVGGPREPEVHRLLDLARVRHRLQLDWLEFDLLVREMASEHSRSAREWLAVLEGFDGQPVTRQILREARLLSGSGLDERSALEQLDAMTGLAPVKKFLRRRRDRLASMVALEGRARTTEPAALHLVFRGNPGTGKTTVARLVGAMYRDLGLLERGHLVECSRHDLVADHEGGSALRTLAKIEEATDGVLFIDEAYSLTPERADPFGQEVVETLLREMGNRHDRLVVIVAGYPEEMGRFLRANPGLNRRFPESNRIDFPDYSAEELAELLVANLAAGGLDLDGTIEGAVDVEGLPNDELIRSALAAVARGVHATAGQHFGNAGEMQNLAQEILDGWSERVRPILAEESGAAQSSTDMWVPPLAVADIPERFQGFLAAQPATEAEILARLDGLTGLHEVKVLLRELVATLRQRERRGRSLPVAPHLLFVGSPGTGKTTVARLVGELFATMGLLRSGHVVNALRADLVGQYVGQSAPRTRAKVREALDGVLLIDEAYTLAQGGQHDFGDEVIGELIAQMEDGRGRLVVIAAGYEDRMDTFLAANQGLGSRFSATVRFADYSSPELVEILESMAAAEGLTFGHDALEAAAEWLERRRAVAGPAFGNAREVRRLVELMERRQAARLQARGDEIPLDQWDELTVADVPEDVA